MEAFLDPGKSCTLGAPVLPIDLHQVDTFRKGSGQRQDRALLRLLGRLAGFAAWIANQEDLLILLPHRLPLPQRWTEQNNSNR